MKKRLLVNALLSLVSIPFVYLGIRWYEFGFNIIVAVSFLVLIILASALIVVMHR